MKSYLGFVVGCVVGAAAVGLVSWLHLVQLQSKHEGSVSSETHRRLQDRHLANIIDSAQLALMLRAIEPELEPEWMEETLLLHAREIGEEFRGSVIAQHALSMIRGYYIKNELPVPTEISEIFRSFVDDLKLSKQNSVIAVADTFNDRLQRFDSFMARRLQQGHDFAPAVAPDEPVIRVNEFFKNAVSF